MKILTLPEVRRYAASSCRIGDFQEYRLDLSKDWDHDTFSLFTTSAILTARGDALSQEMLNLMIHSKPLVDLDIKDYQCFPDAIPASRLILSIHLDTFDANKIHEFLMLQIDAIFYKIIFLCNHFAEILITKDLIQKSGKTNVIFNVTGKWSKLQRSLYQDFGSIGYYAAWDKVLVPNQIHEKEISSIRVNIRDSHTKIYGIVGDIKVNRSLSLTKYNELFHSAAFNACILPLPAEDLEELILVLRFLFSRYTPAGLVVTSPFKKILANYFQSELGVINTVKLTPTVFGNGHYHSELGLFVSCTNTDLDALKQALKILYINAQDNICIYGSGDCAEIFGSFLLSNGFYNLNIIARNAAKASELCSNLKLKSTLTRENYDLLINASFLGWDDSDEIGALPAFKKLIDLPYRADGKPTTLSIRAKQDNIPLLNGTDFWHLQHEFQKKFLLS